MRRRTQVAKGEVCKTSIQRFESARRLHPEGSFPDQIRLPAFAPPLTRPHRPIVDTHLIDRMHTNPGHPPID